MPVRGGNGRVVPTRDVQNYDPRDNSGSLTHKYLTVTSSHCKLRGTDCVRVCLSLDDLADWLSFYDKFTETLTP
jgi:hypothetical protein